NPVETDLPTVMRFFVMRDCDGSHIRVPTVPRQVRNTTAQSEIAGVSVLRDRDFVQTACQQKTNSTQVLPASCTRRARPDQTGSAPVPVVAMPRRVFLNYHGRRPQRLQK